MLYVKKCLSEFVRFAGIEWIRREVANVVKYDNLGKKVGILDGVVSCVLVSRCVELFYFFTLRISYVKSSFILLTLLFTYTYVNK